MVNWQEKIQVQQPTKIPCLKHTNIFSFNRGQARRRRDREQAKLERLLQREVEAIVLTRHRLSEFVNIFINDMNSVCDREWQ